jgi:hypothetical protein
MNRREFVVLGASCVAIASSSPLASSRKTSAPVLALADPRYKESFNFAQAVTRPDGAMLAISPDIGTVWFELIQPRLRHGAVRLAGLTLPSDLFILERLAGRQAATLYSAWHDCRGTLARHTFCGAVPLGPAATSVEAAGGNWPAALGAVIRDGIASSRIGKQHLSVQLAPLERSPNFWNSWLIELA